MELSKVLENRRSAHYFDTEARLDEADIKEIYDVAKNAPSSFNLQPWKLLIVGDPENKKKLRGCALDQPKVEEASHVVVLLGDKEAYRAENMDPVLDDFIANGYFEEKMRDGLKGMAQFLYNGEHERPFAARNVGLFAMALMLAAEDKGIASHPMDGFDRDKLREAFNIPDRYDIVMLIALGKRDKTKILLDRCSRRDFDEVVVREGF